MAGRANIVGKPCLFRATLQSAFGRDDGPELPADMLAQLALLDRMTAGRGDAGATDRRDRSD